MPISMVWRAAMLLTAWGRFPVLQAQGCCFDDLRELLTCLQEEGQKIVYGAGRSYGDSALNPNVIFSRRFSHILAFDSQTGVVTCESGVTLAALIDAFLPRGWFPAVTPGTRFITVGGAIASDVHGKNHHQRGCFSQGVISFDLMLADGAIVRCSREQNRDLFLATCGGMGLTGVILTATFHMQQVPSSYMREVTYRCRNLAEVVALFEAHHRVPYSVAWLDCLATGDSLGRALLMVGDFAPEGPRTPPAVKSLAIPLDLPGFLLNKHFLAWFNQLYYQRVKLPVRERMVDLFSFFYPLDALLQWNRLYGKGGFTQYQLVLPKAAALRGLEAILRRVLQWRGGAFLGTLKLFGPENENYLSFPLEGYTMAMDFKIHPDLFQWLDELDRVVLDHGGRLYLTKDARMPARVFRQGYPRWDQFQEVREKLGLHRKFASRQSRRLEI
jgi:decaprenylphospho-beta-D-ribofuranose 2-oxidase